MGVFSWLWLGESMYPLKIAGLILGFAGVAVISAAGFGGHISIAGILLALGSAVSWALGTVYVKRTGGRADSIWMVALQLLIGGVLLVSSGRFSESFSAIQWKAPFILSLLFISVFVIALGWLAFFTLVGSGEASKVASYTFLIPLISIVVSSIFLHEPLTVSLLAGLLLIVTSICFVNITPKKLKTPALAAEKKAVH